MNIYAPFIFAFVVACIAAFVLVTDRDNEYETIMNTCLNAAMDDDKKINACWANEPV